MRRMLSWKDKSLDGGLDKDKLGKNSITYGVLLLALAAMTFFGVCDPTRSRLRGGGGISGSAGEVGGEVISRAEFNRAYRAAYDRYQKQFGEQFNPSQLRLAHNVMQELVDERAMYLKAVDLGLKASDDEVLNLLKNEFKGENGQFSEEVFDNFLNAQGYTEATFMDEVRRSVTVQKLRRFVTDTALVSTKSAEIDYKLNETKLDVEYLQYDPQKIDLTVTPEEIQKYVTDAATKAKVKEYFDQNAKEFNQPEQVKARHILVQYKGSRNATPEAEKRTKEEAKRRAEELAAKAKTGDFAELAKANTDEPQGKVSGGDLGWFSKEAMVPEFSEATFKMAKGDVSGVVETPFGFHVIKVEDKKAAVATKLEDAQNKIAETLIGKEKRPLMAKEQAEKALAALKEKKPVEGATWAATGELPASTKYLPGIGTSKEASDALAALKNVGDVSPGVIDVRGNYYILRLKSKKEPDMAKFDKEKQRELTASAAYTEGYALYNQWEKQIREEMDKKQKVWKNPDYLALDDRGAEKG
jgi:peptidyl-prolyl cis-trans isomerase D